MKKGKAEYERAEKLVKDQIVSQKEFENARLNYQNAKTAYEAISGKQSAKGVGITTPLTGYLKNISVKDGEYVTGIFICHVRKRRDASGRCSDAYDPGEVSSSTRQKI